MVFCGLLNSLFTPRRTKDREHASTLLVLTLAAVHTGATTLAVMEPTSIRLVLADRDMPSVAHYVRQRRMRKGIELL